jgi:Ser/Thr protein kinase RdoA (MazF antagonist)
MKKKKRPQIEQLAQPYEGLTPDVILDAVEAAIGQRCDGRLLALNSFENRVYQVWLENGEQVVAKFYRPQRWSDAAILEEHSFTQALAEREIPVVAPLVGARERSLQTHCGFRLALYPKRPGRAPELDDSDTLTWLGRFIARIHAVGALEPFRQRPQLDIESYGSEPSAFVLEGGFVPADLAEAYRSTVQMALERVGDCYARAGRVRNIRLHGDCHAGNMLWTESGPHFVDFDDCRMGPALQDLWMLMSGERPAKSVQLAKIMQGYREFFDFDRAELNLLEALRTLRMIHYSGWLARRWQDPAFPANFPWFNTPRYWQDQILQLREQVAAMDEAPLELEPA